MGEREEKLKIFLKWLE